MPRFQKRSFRSLDVAEEPNAHAHPHTRDCSLIFIFSLTENEKLRYTSNRSSAWLPTDGDNPTFRPFALRLEGKRGISAINRRPEIQQVKPQWTQAYARSARLGMEYLTGGQDTNGIFMNE